ncbi:MAG: hypothetical protein ACTHNU_11635, partial [Gaiellales bacterium]
MRRVGLLWSIVVCCVLMLSAVGVARSRADIRRVSVSALGRQANADSTFPSISGGGRYFAFASSASNLVRGDTNH